MVWGATAPVAEIAEAEVVWGVTAPVAEIAEGMACVVAAPRAGEEVEQPVEEAAEIVQEATPVLADVVLENAPVPIAAHGASVEPREGQVFGERQQPG